jgi:anaerobic glycerol-3-phosphate dehydrogenase
MAEPSVVVLGAGMAGTAAAFAALEHGARVAVVHDRAGASALYSGALDLEPWDDEGSPRAVRRERAPRGSSELEAFIAALGVHRLGRGGVGDAGLVATSSGVVRCAVGADRALLELAPLAGRRIAVADVERDDWDAPLLARTLAASEWAERTKTSFVPVEVRPLRAGHERRISPYDFAALFDDPARRGSLADALARASRDIDAWLLGPWLGVTPATATAFQGLLRLPAGESTSPTGGAAGARFEAARDRLFTERGVDVRRGRVTRVSNRGSRWGVEFRADDDERGAELEAPAVVLATGGVAAGGIGYSWRLPEIVRGFELGYAAPVALALDGELLGGGGSLYGPSLETKGFGALERVGIAADALGRPVGTADAENGLFVVGDAVSGRPRTMLEAALSGLAAGNVAVRG